MPNVAIHCKASVADGMGHIYRQINIAKELKNRGYEISFYIPEFTPAINLLTQSQFTPRSINREFLITKYLDKFFDFIILDMQDTTESLVASIKKFARQIVSLEDLGTGRNYVDLLIDCNLAPSKSKNISTNTKALFGPNYSVLHPNFSYYHKQPRNFNTSINSLLITMGATDPQELTLPLAKLLLKKKKITKLTVLTGHNTTNRSKLNELSAQFKSLDILGPVPNIAQILWEHEAVVCAGGITLHEAIAVGTPAFVINQVNHQQTKALFIEKSGAAINLGLGRQFDIEKLEKAISLKKPVLESMSLKGQNLVDGQGVIRVIEAMINMAKS
jgi:spore coat polysaccharide biosynthesis predicted glycosyltransferase SpsG